MRFLKLFFVSVMVVIAGSALFYQPQTVEAFTAVDCSKLGVPSGQCSSVSQDGLSQGRAGSTVWRIVSVALYILAGVCVIMVIIGGLYLAVSQGDAGRVKKAKDTIFYAVIGVVVALFAGAIVQFVAGYFTSIR